MNDEPINAVEAARELQRLLSKRHFEQHVEQLRAVFSGPPPPRNMRLLQLQPLPDVWISESDLLREIEGR